MIQPPSPSATEGAVTTITNPNTLGVFATAEDPDDGDTLTYTWAGGGTFDPPTGASTTWTPPDCNHSHLRNIDRDSE